MNTIVYSGICFFVGLVILMGLVFMAFIPPKD